jgi:hypothetical protein
MEKLAFDCVLFTLLLASPDCGHEAIFCLSAFLLCLASSGITDSPFYLHFSFFLTTLKNHEIKKGIAIIRNLITNKTANYILRNITDLFIKLSLWLACYFIVCGPFLLLTGSTNSKNARIAELRLWNTAVEKIRIEEETRI